MFTNSKTFTTLFASVLASFACLTVATVAAVPAHAAQAATETVRSL